MQNKRVVLRQCIACREMKEKRSMLRVVRDPEGKIFLDFSSKASGRGAYICNDPECVKKLCKAKILNKVFGCAVDEEVYSRISEEFLGSEQN